jgi:hypothetical protein
MIELDSISPAPEQEVVVDGFYVLAGLMHRSAASCNPDF